MITWRTTYMWYLLPGLMLAFLVYIGWASGRLPEISFPGQEVSSTPMPLPSVAAAISIPLPAVNPVLHIEVPAKSLFAP